MIKTLLFNLLFFITIVNNTYTIIDGTASSFFLRAKLKYHFMCQKMIFDTS